MNGLDPTRPDPRDRPCSVARLCALVLVFMATPVAATTEDAPPPLLDQIVVTATRSSRRAVDVPTGFTLLDREAIARARPTLGIDEALRRVPGALIQNTGNFAQDLRLQIRGFGTRAAFGIREIRVIVDGLPETLPDGQTQIDAIDPFHLDRIEVLRGPAAALYGNASGGVIQAFTVAPPDRPRVRARIQGGSFGHAKVAAQAGGQAGPIGVNVSGSYLRQDGFRDHSATESGTFYTKLAWAPTDRTHLQYVIDFVDSGLAQDPGGITRETAREDRKAARDRNLLQNAGEEVRQIKTGFTFRHDLPLGTLAGHAYLLHRAFDARLPILAPGSGIVEFERLSPGGGVRWEYDRPLWEMPQEFSIGIDVQHQRDARRRFVNDAGRRADLALDQDERVTAFGIWVREALRPREDLEISVGTRYDRVHYDVDVAFPEESTAGGSRSIDQWSPTASVRWSPTPQWTLFAQWATAFQAPTTTELARPEGAGFNPEVDPQRADSVEIGLRHRFAGGHHVGLSAYWIELDDLLVAAENDGRTFFENLGRSRRYGVEADWHAVLPGGFEWNGATTFLHAEFRGFGRTTRGDADFQGDALRGNREPGIPSWVVFQELAYRNDAGTFASLELLYVDRIFVDNVNESQSPSYVRLDVRAGHRFVLDELEVEPFVAIQNLTDTNYDGTVRLNAFGGRFFEPAPGFSIWAGLTLQFGAP